MLWSHCSIVRAHAYTHYGAQEEIPNRGSEGFMTYYPFTLKPRRPSREFQEGREAVWDHIKGMMLEKKKKKWV